MGDAERAVRVYTCLATWLKWITVAGAAVLLLIAVWCVRDSVVLGAPIFLTGAVLAVLVGAYGCQVALGMDRYARRAIEALEARVRELEARLPAQSE